MALLSRSNIIQLDPSEIPEWIFQGNLAQYLQVATATVLLYDIITTMDKEVKYFWVSRPSTVTIVFFANRYIGFFGAMAYVTWDLYGVNIQLCNFSQWSRSSSNWVIILALDYILMIRVLALYSQDRKLSICLRTLLGLEAVTKMGIFIYLNLAQQISVFGLGEGNSTTCGEGSELNVHFQKALAIIDWTLPLAYGVLLMVLALYKAAEFWRLSAGFKGFTLVKVLIQDQAIYFVLAVSCCVLNLLEFQIVIQNDFLANLLEVIGNPSFLCILGSRMLFNMKEAGERGVNAGTSYKLRTISAMEFC